MANRYGRSRDNSWGVIGRLERPQKEVALSGSVPGSAGWIGECSNMRGSQPQAHLCSQVEVTFVWSSVCSLRGFLSYTTCLRTLFHITVSVALVLSSFDTVCFIDWFEISNSDRVINICILEQNVILYFPMLHSCSSLYPFCLHMFYHFKHIYLLVCIYICSLKFKCSAVLR